MSTDTQRIDEIISTLKTRQQTNRLNYYQPYQFQTRFHDSGSSLIYWSVGESREWI